MPQQGGFRAIANAVGVVVLAIFMGNSWYRRLRPASDSADQICREVAWFRDNAVGFVVPAPKALDMFLATCTSELAKLEEAPRARLLQLLQQKKLRDTLMREVIPNLPGKSVTDDAAASSSIGMSCTVPDGHPKNEHRPFGYTSLQARMGSVDEIADSFKRGEVMSFDARPLLPSWLIGASAEKIVSKLGTQAKEAPVFCSSYGSAKCEVPGESTWQNWLCMRILMQLARKAPKWGASSWRVYAAVWVWAHVVNPLVCEAPSSMADLAAADFVRVPEFERLAEVQYENGTSKPELEPLGPIFKKLLSTGKMLPAANVNIRRLPDLLNSSQILSRLHLEEQVEHTLGLLWLGATGGSWRMDMQDNILMQLYDEADVFVFPPSCTSNGSEVLKIEGRFGIALGHFIAFNQSKRKQLPWYHVRLRPGEGIAIPSHSMHTVISTSSQRIGVNLFLEPRFEQMQWEAAPYNAFVNFDTDALAVRTLWVRTIRELWDAHGVSMAMHTDKMEIL